MPQLVLQPCGSRSSLDRLRRTTLEPVFLEGYRSLLPEELQGRGELFKGGVRLYSFSAGFAGYNVSAFHKVRPGADLLFFGGGAIFARATVLIPFQSIDLSNALYGEGENTPLFYALGVPEPVLLPYGRFIDAIGYRGKPQRLAVLSPHASETLSELLDGQARVDVFSMPDGRYDYNRRLDDEEAASTPVTRMRSLQPDAKVAEVPIRRRVDLHGPDGSTTAWSLPGAELSVLQGDNGSSSVTWDTDLSVGQCLSAWNAMIKLQEQTDKSAILYSWGLGVNIEVRIGHVLSELDSLGMPLFSRLYGFLRMYCEPYSFVWQAERRPDASDWQVFPPPAADVRSRLSVAGENLDFQTVSSLFTVTSHSVLRSHSQFLMTALESVLTPAPRRFKRGER